MSRRKMLLALSSLALSSVANSPSLIAQTTPKPIAILKLHNFGIKVSDVRRSQEFYQGLFGMPVQAHQGSTVCLRIGNGPHFMSLSPTLANEPPSITHIGLSVLNFDIDQIFAQLMDRGFSNNQTPSANKTRLQLANQCWIRTRKPQQGGDQAGTRELFFADHEGLITQLSDSEYCGGSGAVGNTCAELEPSRTGLLKSVDISHFTNFMSNRNNANQFYTKLFNLDYQAYQGPTSPIVGVGDGTQFLMYVGGRGESTQTLPSTAANINHVCLSVDDFNVDNIIGKLTSYGLKPGENTREGIAPLIHYVTMRMPNRGGAESGTPELYFTDPDGLRIQIQSTDYCGGGGYLGNQCS